MASHSKKLFITMVRYSSGSPSKDYLGRIFLSCILTPSVLQYHFSSWIRFLEFEPLDESLNRKVQMQQLKVEEMTLKVAERRKRVPEQVKMLLDDAIRRQSAMADRIEFENEENQTEEDAEMWEGMEKCSPL